MYVNDIANGITVSNTEPCILKQTVATAHVDGMNLLGPVVGNFSMDVAIKKAKEAGVGWVSAKGNTAITTVYLGHDISKILYLANL